MVFRTVVLFLGFGTRIAVAKGTHRTEGAKYLRPLITIIMLGHEKYVFEQLYQRGMLFATGERKGFSIKKGEQTLKNTQRIHREPLKAYKTSTQKSERGRNNKMVRHKHYFLFRRRKRGE